MVVTLGKAKIIIFESGLGEDVLSWQSKVPPQSYVSPQEIAGPNSRPY